MRVRVHQKNGAFWFGQKYNKNRDDWEDVTDPCYTSWGAQLALNIYVKKAKKDEGYEA